MSIENPKYDVAISFLAKDEEIAAELYASLNKVFEVFFFTKRQESLAGTDGLASMREPFLNDSRIVVVLYRENWGKTKWTAVEETAIKDRGFEHGWDHLFFIALDHESPIPKWLPEHRVRFNYTGFGLVEAIGAIKARVIESGGEYTPLTALKRAQMLQDDEKYRRDKSAMSNLDGIEKIIGKARELFNGIERSCEIIKAKGLDQIRFGTSFNER